MRARRTVVPAVLLAALSVVGCSSGDGLATESPSAGAGAGAGSATVDPLVVVAPFMVVQYSRDTASGMEVVTAVVKARDDGRLRVAGFSCPFGSCEELAEDVAGTLDATSPYALTVAGSFGDLRLTGPGAKKDVLSSRCPSPHGFELLVASPDFDQITWTGTADGRRLKAMACNFYVRSGTARISRATS